MQFAQIGISNTFANRDKTGPIVSSVTVENLTPNSLTIQLSDVNNISDIVPVNTSWIITGATNSPLVTSQLIDEVSKIVYLFLNVNILDDDTPLLTYTNPGDETGIQDVHGNEMASFSNYAVVNNIGQVPVFSGNDNLLHLFNLGFTGSTIEDKSGLNNDGSLVKSHCLTSDGTTVLTFSSLAGITITSWEGTSTLTKSGNTITTTSGTFYNILLSNGTRLPVADGSGSTILFDAVNTLNATVTGTVDWTGNQNTFHWNITQGFSHLGRMNAINQYISLTSNIPFSTTQFSIKIIYAADSIVTTQDLWGTATTNTQLAMGTSSGNINGTLRLGSGTTYTLTCASSAATIGYANGAFCTFIVTRDSLGVVIATLNGFTLLINGSASVTDSTSTTISQFCRTSTSNNNIGILKEVEILDAATSSLIGTKYNADNGFLGTLQGGFILKKYPKPQGGDVSHRNLAGNWHNGAETSIKPNPSNNAAITTATGWTNSTELSYSGLDSVANPAFINVKNPIRKRNLVVWETTLEYEEELIANNYVGDTTINVNKATGWSTSNHLSYAAGSTYNPDPTGFTIKIVVDPIFFTTAQIIFGKTASVSAGNGFGVCSPATNASGADLSLFVRDGTNTIKRSRSITFSEKETEISILHFGLRSDGVGGYELFSVRNGHRENTVVPVVGLTHGTDDMVIGSLSGGNAYGGGILAVAYYQNKGMTDNEIEASYQQTKNNLYVQEDGITLLFAAESGNANWVDRVSGAVTMTKSGTLTITSMSQIFNYRFRPEDYSDDPPLSPPLANTSTAIRIMCVGDSRMDPDTFSLKFCEELYTLVKADPDIGNAEFCGFFSDTLTGVAGTPTYRHHAINGTDSSSMRSGGGGNVGVHTALAYPDGSPTIVLLFIGTNATSTETNFNTEVNEYPILVNILRNNSPAGLRIAVMEELEHDDANRRARLQDLSYQHRHVIWPKLQNTGYTLCKTQQWRSVKIMDNTFSDAVHQNNTGNILKAQRAFSAIKRTAGYAV